MTVKDTEEDHSQMPWTESTSVSPDSPIFETRHQRQPLRLQKTKSSSLSRYTQETDSNGTRNQSRGSGRLLASDGAEFPEEEDDEVVLEDSQVSYVRPVPITAEAILAEYEQDEEKDVPADMLRVSSASADDVAKINRAQAHHNRMPSTIYEEPGDDYDETRRSCNDEQQMHPLKRTEIPSSAQGIRQRRSVNDLHSATLHQLSHDNQTQIPVQTQPIGSPLRKQTPCTTSSPMSSTSTAASSSSSSSTEPVKHFEVLYSSTKFFEKISAILLKQHYTPFTVATWIGFWALMNVTCANYVLTPMRDAIALAIGVEHIPSLTLASTILAFFSSVPIGWLFEAPDPNRRKMFKRMGLTRGETQGTSLALFYRCFAIILISYAVGFSAIEWLTWNDDVVKEQDLPAGVSRWWPDWKSLFAWIGKFLYIAFFLVVHLMKLHCLSLVWGVTTEAMEYEEVARKRSKLGPTNTRLQRLALVGFGGTLGGILGSGIASSMARLLRLPGLLLVAAALLEISAELSIELGRIMQKHWEEQQLFQSSNDLQSLDASMKKSASVGSMKRIASGNSLNRVKSATELTHPTLSGSPGKSNGSSPNAEVLNDDTFFQRLLRGVTTILRSRLLMAIFTYNALYASTTVLLSFQRAALVASRSKITSAEADTAFLANINMASSVVVFGLQASGVGATLAQSCGSRGTLALMPLIRLLGVLSLAWWHHSSEGKPPNLLLFLVLDECCKIMNLAVAKPVRESLWRGLSNEARYEAKPIVDTLANRWGSGSAAFLVSFLNGALDLLGFQAKSDGTHIVFGFPPVLLLCMIIAAWWAAVSADLGHIRYRIDLELKKRQ